MAKPTEIDLPHLWDPRPYQVPAWRFLDRGGLRAALCWHRRAGKDAFGMNWTACAAHDRIGVYWHMLPTQKQARKVIWDRIDRDTGRKAIDLVFPPALRRKPPHETEMKIELKCGSLWQLCGSDNYDSLVGGDPLGVVFSEYSLADPAAWDYIRPILAENGGWALFIFTPRGRNHAYRVLQAAERLDDWFGEVLTVDDTRRPDGMPVIAPDAIQADRASGMSEATLEQEYWCSFDAAIEGAYYGEALATARREGRIGRVPWEPQVPVETWWDLGIGDATAIWFVQRVAKEVRFIDYLEESGEGLAFYAKALGEKPYVYGRHLAPHDIEVRELGTGKSRKEVARGLGIRFETAPKLPIEDGIEAVRNLLPTAWFDDEKCARGIDALTMYRKEFDDKAGAFKDRPLHDWSSHGADAMRTGAVVRAPSTLSGQTFEARVEIGVL